MDFSIFKRAKEVNIVDVISQYIPVQYKNGRYQALCPFHADRHMGNFFIAPDIGGGIYHCFSCQEGGDAVEFVSKFCGINRYEAAKRILNENGISIPEDRAAYHAPVVQKPEILLSPKADISQIDLIYSCFSALVEAAIPKYSQELLEKRKVKPEHTGDYFVFPDKSETHEIMKNLRSILSTCYNQEELSDNDMKELLLGVPGFYLNKQGKIVAWLPKEEYLGIVTHDIEGRCSGLQMRNMSDNWDKGCRYRFYSSSFASGKDGLSYGCSSTGYIEDVLYPTEGNKKKKTIAITEGRFKAEQLRNLGFPTVNMHSICNNEPAGNTAIALANKLDSSSFLLAYDAERTTHIEHSAKYLYEKLRSTGKVSFLTWNPDCGKGVDDVINSGHIRKIKVASPEKYFSEF